MPVKISILISTKNRCNDLLLTLGSLAPLLNENVRCVVFDDGSTDGTFEKTEAQFPQISLHRNEISKGYLYCRNKMLNETTADFAISLDDDANFLIEDPIERTTSYFAQNPKCGLIAARIFWSAAALGSYQTNEVSQKVKSFVGCGHVWRMEAWHDIPNYPEWFEFYGEENFASLQLFKKKWEVHYLPEILIQHRVDLKERAKSNKDFSFRNRRLIRSDWYNFFLFLPLARIPKIMIYSIWMQLKNKVFKGDFKIIRPLVLALFDLMVAFPKLIRHRSTLTSAEYQQYLKLGEAKIYWNTDQKKYLNTPDDLI